MACSALIAPLLLAFAPSSEERHYTALDFLNFSQTVGAARGRHIVVFLDKGSSDYAEHERTLNAAVPNIECLVPGGIAVLNLAKDASRGRERDLMVASDFVDKFPGIREVRCSGLCCCCSGLWCCVLLLCAAAACARALKDQRVRVSLSLDDRYTRTLPLR